MTIEHERESDWREAASSLQRIIVAAKTNMGFDLDQIVCEEFDYLVSKLRKAVAENMTIRDLHVGGRGDILAPEEDRKLKALPQPRRPRTGSVPTAGTGQRREPRGLRSTNWP